MGRHTNPISLKTSLQRSQVLLLDPNSFATLMKYVKHLTIFIHKNTNWILSMKPRLIILFLSTFCCLHGNAKTIRVHDSDRANAVYGRALLMEALEYFGEKYQFEKVRGTDVTARAVRPIRTYSSRTGSMWYEQ